MLFDTHMHTEFSSDSKMKIIDALEIAKNNNKGIIITEHLDPTYPKKNEFKCDIAKYLKTYEPYRNSLNNILLGIEIGLSDIKSDFDDSIGNTYNLDYIIGSIHSVYREDIYLDYVKNKVSKYDYFKKYFDYMKKCIELHSNFDSLGHIDYICRYCPYENGNIDITDFKNELFDIFKLLLSKNKVIELNTVRLSNKDTSKNLYDIFSIYKDAGGKYITIGSDAHISSDIYRNWDSAIKFCADLDLKPVYFKNRQMIIS